MVPQLFSCQHLSTRSTCRKNPPVEPVGPFWVENILCKNDLHHQAINAPHWNLNAIPDLLWAAVGFSRFIYIMSSPVELLQKHSTQLCQFTPATCLSSSDWRCHVLQAQTGTSTYFVSLIWCQFCACLRICGMETWQLNRHNCTLNYFHH